MGSDVERVYCVDRMMAKGGDLVMGSRATHMVHQRLPYHQPPPSSALSPGYSNTLGHLARTKGEGDKGVGWCLCGQTKGCTLESWALGGLTCL
jgi:hypothetical protein